MCVLSKSQGIVPPLTVKAIPEVSVAMLLSVNGVPDLKPEAGDVVIEDLGREACLAVTAFVESSIQVS